MLTGTRAVAGLVGAVLLAGCGTTTVGTGSSGEDAGDRREPSAGAKPPVVTVDGEVMLTCGGTPSFAASVARARGRRGRRRRHRLLDE